MRISIQTLRQNTVLQIPVAIVTTILALLLPYLVHLVPQGGTSLGARLLPMYYAPFLAALLINPMSGLIAGFAAPLLNHWITGLPTLEMAFILSLELAAFTSIAGFFHDRRAWAWWLAPVSYLLAKVVSTIILALIPQLIPVSPLTFGLTVLGNAWPGVLAMIVLTFLGRLLARKMQE